MIATNLKSLFLLTCPLILHSTFCAGLDQTAMAPGLMFNFSQVDNLDGWFESSDTVRTVGKSKATFALQSTQVFQRAIFFTLLNPQDNGAGFAGVRTQVEANLEDVEAIEIRCRGQGSATHYKVLIRDESIGQSGDGSFEAIFQPSLEEFTDIALPLSKFQFYYRGELVADHPPLDLAHISDIGLQVFGGVYSEFKQSGVSSLEVDWIRST